MVRIRRHRAPGSRARSGDRSRHHICRRDVGLMDRRSTIV